MFYVIALRVFGVLGSLGMTHATSTVFLDQLGSGTKVLKSTGDCRPVRMDVMLFNRSVMSTISNGVPYTPIHMNHGVWMPLYAMNMILGGLHGPLFIPVATLTTLAVLNPLTILGEKKFTIKSLSEYVAI